MQKERISITFEVDLDLLPGACHTLEDWVDYTRQWFTHFAWYNPEITNSMIVKEAPDCEDQIKAIASNFNIK